jgi:hypothetical protein
VNIIEKEMAENTKLKEIFAILKELDEIDSDKTKKGSEFSIEEQRKEIAFCLGLEINNPKVDEILNAKDDE